MDIIAALTDEFKLKRFQVENTVNLIDEGNTIPFIARYRKEAHGSLDDQTLRAISERLEYLRNLDKRREEISGSIISQEKMTDELQEKIDNAATLAELEDLYRPYKPKRKTRASVAKEKGLEPLAQAIFAQAPDADPAALAVEFVDPEKEVPDVEAALAGASDIIAEDISDNADIRRRLRNLFSVVGVITSKGKSEEDSVYSMYYDFSDKVEKIAGHKILAINRGEKEGFLKVSVSIDRDKAIEIIEKVTVTGSGLCSSFVQAAGEDAYDRLIYPSVENETRAMLTERASTAAIKVFAQNLRPLLMAPPVKGKVCLGLDPGYRTGCKVACVDATGRVLDTGVIYVTKSAAEKADAEKYIVSLIKKHSVDIISIGNGTASKETEIFVADMIKNNGLSCSYMVVSEAGASVYSASPLAAAEFPQYDVSLRSAVSIARRLQDPLAELVKIEPKAIGVGQYQHDMPPKELETALDGVVEDCVNSVGADLNTASPSLLSHISGINSTIAKNIVTYREENGAFSSRAALKKVPKLGPKAYEQCAGFLRISESKNVLDNTGVHPESYDAAKALLTLCGYELSDVREGNLPLLHARLEDLGYAEVAGRLGVGEPTLHDIENELLKPGRDPRDELPPPLLRSDVMQLSDLRPGMVLKGTVRNVIDFGAFVDIGVHQDGLVHISQIADRYIKHPSEVLSVGDVVTVKVLEVDEKKQRIGLSMRGVKSET